MGASEMNLLKVIIAWAIVAAVLIGGPLAYGGCHHLFRQNVVHHAHVQAVIAQPLYFAGQSTHDEALLRKAIRAEAPAILREALQQMQAPQQQVVTGAFAKCAKCHKGDNALTSDPATFKAFARMAGLGEGIPNEMRAVIGGLSTAEKGELTEYLLRLPAAQPEAPGVLSLRTKPDLQRFPLPPTTNVQPPEPLE
jgi:cytochrome c553